MLSTGRLVLWIYLLLPTLLLSAGQVWVLRTPAPRHVRYALVWLFAVALLTLEGCLLYRLWEPGGDPGTKEAYLVVLLLAAMVISTVGLWAGARWGGTPRPTATFLQRAAPLAGLHSAVVLLGAALTFIVILGVGLARMR